MLAFLKLIPLRDWLKIGAVVAVLSWFGWFTIHERSVGKDEALAPVKVLAQKAAQQVATGTAVAQTMEETNGKSYDAAVSRPAVRPLGIVCRNTGSSALPQANDLGAPGVGVSAPNGASGLDYDPSGAALERALKADAQITYLQGRVHELETQMEASP